MARKSAKPADERMAESVAAIGKTFPPPEGTRVMVTLSAEAIHLLDTAVLVDGQDRNQVVERLILDHLSGYYSGRRAAGEGASGLE